ncbi:uncharacterized protein PFL1_03257 [Pseudozyma flocculosa PF-1]|uniref:VHS domain-containing protein n=2 Tax=Pseudozyma flocculosa TaxID=84751 RepID=A0A5C3F706_9BASI|nr:uncharacterized protein PFL1_03257 [Pseudozyma flocculosa PF-1]EPQ28967.1 hypothetical protein PFL1_03257 [Pseudozyma flocculosa PF-1]SPO39960.1 uncharacterized protein PSFLO_05442 [Pseudozyma flocculosa]
MMRELAGQAQGFYSGSKKPFSAVSDWIDRLCTQKYAEEDLDGIPELVEAINLQSTGPAEASRALRKKMKYSNVHGQKRALIILRYCVENCNKRFQTTFANDQLIERLKLMSQDELVDASVRRLLMRVLLSWHHQFKDDPSMRTVAGLYVACGGGKKSDAQKKSEAAEAYRKREEEARREQQIRSDRKAAERLQKLEEKELAKRKKKGGASGAAKRPAFNFEQEKPQILSSLATSQSSATALVNALQHVNREKESVTENARVQDYLARVKVERKKIIRYIQLVKDEEFIGSLISANDQIILALQLYDRLSKPVELDSDEDNEPLAAISGGETAEQKQAARLEADDAEIELVRKRIAAARLNAPEGELEKLQDRQRGRIERHNTRVGSIRSFDMGGSASAGAGEGAVGDLMDLNFDDDQTTTSSARGGGGGMTASESAGSGFQARGGALSDYSDYDESEESDGEGQGHRVPVGRSTRPDGASWTNLNDSEEEEWLQATQGHRPRIGPGFSWNEGDDDNDDDEAEDPFADPFADANAGPAAIQRPSNQPRREWAAV